MKKGIYYNIPEDYKYSLAFNAKLNKLSSEEGMDKYLSLASKSDFRKYIPNNIDFQKKIDFLGFAGEGFIANRLNVNNDGIGTKEAIEVAKLFPMSFVDAEHSRKNIIGVVLTTSFAEIGTGKELTEEEVKNSNEPFCVIIGGIIWKLANPELAEMIEECGSSTASKEDSLFLSWELGFSDYNLIIIDAKKSDFKDGKIISDIKEIETIENYSGASNYMVGSKIGKIPVGRVIPLGIGIVEDPAAKVQPITTSRNLSIEAKNMKTEENKEQTIELTAAFNFIEDKDKADVVINLFSDNNLESTKIIDKLSEVDKNFNISATELTDSLENAVAKAFVKFVKNKDKEKSSKKCPECGQMHANQDEDMDDEMEVKCAKCGKPSKGKSWKNGTDKEKGEESMSKIDKNKNNISHSTNNNVNANRNLQTNMKIKDISELNDETMKECNASEIKELAASSFTQKLNDEIAKIATSYKEKEKIKDDALLASQQTVKDIQDKYTKVQESLDKLVQASEAKEKIQVFSARMNSVENAFELNESQKMALAEDIKTISDDESFAKFLKKQEIFLKKKDATPKQEIVAAAAPAVDPQKLVGEALANADKKKENIPNAGNNNNSSQKDKAREAFGINGWVFTPRR